MKGSASANGSVSVLSRGTRSKKSSAAADRPVVRDLVFIPAEIDARPRIDPGFACFELRLGKSKIHRWGVYTKESIPARRKVIEYTGERISRRETKRRAETSEHIYLFTLDPYWAIDGSVGGSGAEYINHCCEPNLVARILKGHIVYVSLRDIRPGEELTVDYHFDKKVERVECCCGAGKCRGTINLL